MEKKFYQDIKFHAEIQACEEWTRKVSFKQVQLLVYTGYTCTNESWLVLCNALLNATHKVYI